MVHVLDHGSLLHQIQHLEQQGQHRPEEQSLAGAVTAGGVGWEGGGRRGCVSMDTAERGYSHG